MIGVFGLYIYVCVYLVMGLRGEQKKEGACEKLNFYASMPKAFCDDTIDSGDCGWDGGEGNCRALRFMDTVM